ncbi:hypothetical protein Xcel_1559 [Xylanimonas cellulosilytica DSM 15894]|uniref:Uncharacterized protein n=1 Tax=Xylanimonas cellulosilytica (strain DSM 15894 / JCM 12276 / CECT 5975 / KCTC 9989 / LMG 20990 / NBRC 107835 / XIL07) TaxID=446471 RepID=D1BS97_XYLCX|nr:hypothetical protein [Xylanimonas cellulosilytica]ACZ30589.1 hypothetical protein Xcel_1559 [Xylanimonas cellulosilytica DSM 15894]
MAAIQFDIVDPGRGSEWTVTVPGRGGSQAVASAPVVRSRPGALVLACTAGVAVGVLGTWALSPWVLVRDGEGADDVAALTAAAQAGVAPSVSMLAPGLAVVHLPSGQWVVCVLPEPPAEAAPIEPLTAPVQDRVRPTTPRWTCEGAAEEDRFGP